MADQEPLDILQWSRDIIEGPAGMEAYESREVVVWHESDRVAAVNWALRCLANPRCKDSGDVLDAIMERRRELQETAD